MIFPAHRIREQLKKQADVTEDEARFMAARLMGIQGTLAPEDFFYLGQKRGFGGINQPAGVGVSNEAGVWNRSLEPSQVIVERIWAKNDANIYIIPPSVIPLYGTANNIQIRDASGNFQSRIADPPAGSWPVDLAAVLTRVNAAPAVGAIFVGGIVAGPDQELGVVLREGMGVTLFSINVNVADRWFFTTRELFLRVR